MVLGKHLASVPPAQAVLGHSSQEAGRRRVGAPEDVLPSVSPPETGQHHSHLC